jgi:hypothetical protein
MRSRNWPRRFVLACATISAAAAATPVPAIALVDPGDAPQWQALVKNAGWRVIAGAAADSPDARVQSLAAAVAQAVKDGADPARIYLAGRGAATAAVFYTVSRVPDLWAAAIGIEGSPQAAIDTGRIFAANFSAVPTLWVGTSEADRSLAGKLKDAGLAVEYKPAAEVKNQTVLDWLGSHRRDAFPSEIDCETNAPAFARCYWIDMTKFDPAERNDVLATTRLAPTVVPSLNLGAFAYQPDDPGPGILIALPEHYAGPLKANDRIVALEGKPIENAKGYLAAMAQYTEDKPVVATVQRGKDRIRLETRVLVPRREAMLQIVTRTVNELRVTIPPQWADGAKLYWNGLALEKIDGPGCYDLTEESELLHAARCQ